MILKTTPGAKTNIPGGLSSDNGGENYSFFCLNAIESHQFPGELEIVFAVMRGNRMASEENGLLKYLGDFDIINFYLSSSLYLGEWGKGKAIGKSIGRSGMQGQFGRIETFKENNFYYTLLSTSRNLDPFGGWFLHFIEEHKGRGFELDEKLEGMLTEENISRRKLKEYILGSRRSHLVHPIILSEGEYELMLGEVSTEEKIQMQIRIYDKLHNEVKLPFEQYCKYPPNKSLAGDRVLIARGENVPPKDYTPKYAIPERAKERVITGIQNCFDGH